MREFRCRLVLETTQEAKDEAEAGRIAVSEFALAGRADFLVTGDRDLLSMRPVGRARIVRTAELVRLIKPGH